MSEHSRPRTEGSSPGWRGQAAAVIGSEQTCSSARCSTRCRRSACGATAVYWHQQYIEAAQRGGQSWIRQQSSSRAAVQLQYSCSSTATAAAAACHLPEEHPEDLVGVKGVVVAVVHAASAAVLLRRTCLLRRVGRLVACGMTVSQVVSRVVSLCSTAVRGVRLMHYAAALASCLVGGSRHRAVSASADNRPLPGP
jgi:hypothetical protein